MTLFVELTQLRRSRVEVPFNISVLPWVREFLTAFAARNGWDAAMARRLDAVCEEALLTLLRDEEDDGEKPERLLRLVARREGNGAVLEFVVASGEGNIQDRLALLGSEPGEGMAEHEVSLRMLRHLASSVRHRQYHDTDILAIRVTAPDPAATEAA